MRSRILEHLISIYTRLQPPVGPCFIETLPPEVLLLILEHAHLAYHPTRTLALSHVSRAWRPIALQLLFSDVVMPITFFSGPRQSSVQVAKRTALWVKFMSRRMCVPLRFEIYDSDGRPGQQCDNRLRKDSWELDRLEGVRQLSLNSVEFCLDLLANDNLKGQHDLDTSCGDLY